MNKSSDSSHRLFKAIIPFIGSIILVGCGNESESKHQTNDNQSTSIQNELEIIPLTRSSLRWYEDNNLGIAGEVPVDFFSRMASLEDWEETLKTMDVFYLRSASFQKYLSNNPAFSEELASLLAKYGIPLAIDETAATWANSGLASRDPHFSSSLTMLNELFESGFDVRYISLQSVLSKPLKDSSGDNIDYTHST